jgi:hypothetical protein
MQGANETVAQNCGRDGQLRLNGLVSQPGTGKSTSTHRVKTARIGDPGACPTQKHPRRSFRYTQ